MDYDTEILFLTELKTKITNLPISLKEMWLTEVIDIDLIKIPFGCEIKFF